MNHKGMVFNRPCFAEYIGKPVKNATLLYPYPREMLLKHDIFDLFVMDGGAFFFTNQFLGSKSTDAFIKAFTSGKLLKPWTRTKSGDPMALDWFGPYDPEKGPWAPGQKVEQHVWLNRLYFLLPLAQQFLRTGNARWVRHWFGYFESFRRHMPGMVEVNISKPKHSAWVWHDMQVAWRLLVMIHSAAIIGSLRGGKTLSREEWLMIYGAIEKHARWVHAEGEEQLKNHGSGNHFLQKGTALIYTGTLFPEFPDAAKWVQTGRRIVADQMKREIAADGGSIEASPSYSHFIARLYVDPYLVLALNNKPPLKDLEETVFAQYRFLAETMSPAGLSLQVGDSYALDAIKDLQLVGKLLDTRWTRSAATLCLKPSRIAVLKSRKATACLDAMNIVCGHSHMWKPNLLLWLRNMPVLVDGGCVNYDLPEFRTYFHASSAHNVVAPATQPPANEARKSMVLALTHGRPTAAGGTATATCRFKHKDLEYTWTRKVTLENSLLRVTDRVSAPKPARFVLAYHLAKSAAKQSDAGITATCENWKATISCQSAAGRRLKWQVSKSEYVDSSNVQQAGPVLSCSQHGTQLTFETTIACAQG